MNGRVLIVEDETELGRSIRQVLARAGHDATVAAAGDEALALLQEREFDLVLTDFKLPGMDGLELMRRVKVVRPETEVVVMTAFANIPLAVDAIRQGAYDFLSKPFKREELERVVAKAVERQALLSENRRLRQQLAARPGTPLARIIGQSTALRRVLEIVEQVAPSTATVLLEGESGTGKELVAEAVHALSPRRDRPLVKVNCAAIPETLIEAELFGHERGAFTGAIARRDGRFAAANQGTLLLDEVADLSLSVQAKLLRVLQDGAFEPLGGNRTVRTDVRLVAATNTDLRTEVKDGRFREDLYYRLNVIALRLPPLRERRDDVPLLAQHFLEHYAAKNSRRLDGFSREALELLATYQWPGNIRELEHAVERAVVLARGPVVEPDSLPDVVRDSFPVGLASSRTIPIPVGTPLDEVERLLIEETLRRTGGNKQKAAALLGIAPRTIYRKLAGETDVGDAPGGADLPPDPAAQP